MNRTEQLKTFPINKLILSLSAPAIFAFVVSILNIALDRIFLAKTVGTMALSAVSVATGVEMLIQAFSQLIASGASSSIAIELGKNNKTGAERMLGNAFILGIIMSIIITIAGCVSIKPILILYAATADNMDYAVDYTFIMILSTIFFITTQVLNNIIRGMGYSKTATYNFLISIVIHGILNFIFLFVFHMGIRSAAIAGGIGYIASDICALKFLVNSKSVAKLHVSCFKLEKSIVKRILFVGISAFVMQITISIISMVFNTVSSKYGGSIGEAAYGIVYTLLLFIYMPIIGLGQGIQSIIGTNYGANINDRVKETILKSIKYATIFAVGAFVLMELLSKQIAFLFGGDKDQALAQMASNAIRIVGLSISLLGFEMLGASYFQFIGKVKQATFLSGLRQCILLIPLAIILPMFLGISGVFVSFVVSDVLSFGITLFFVMKELRNLNSKTILQV